MILEAKFGDDSLSNVSWLKQIEGKSSTWRNKWNWKKDRRRNINAYPNIYSRESGFFTRGKSTIRFNCKPNEQTKYSFLEQLFQARQVYWWNYRKSRIIILSNLWTRYLIKKFMCKHLYSRAPSPPFPRPPPPLPTVGIHLHFGGPKYWHGANVVNTNLCILILSGLILTASWVGNVFEGKLWKLFFYDEVLVG